MLRGTGTSSTLRIIITCRTLHLVASHHLHVHVHVLSLQIRGFICAIMKMHAILRIMIIMWDTIVTMNAIDIE